MEPETNYTEARQSDMRYTEAQEGLGWIAFAGVMMMLSGSLSFVQGLWAIDQGNDPVVEQANDLFSYTDLETWGWIVLVWGCLVFAAGIAIFAQAQWARWVGVIMASISLVLSFFWVFAFPIAAFTVMFIDLAVLYGLVIYGGRDTSVV